MIYFTVCMKNFIIKIIKYYIILDKKKEIIWFIFYFVVKIIINYSIYLNILVNPCQKKKNC